MIKKTLIPAILFLSFFLAACGEKATAAPEVAGATTFTPDLCSEENLPAEAGKVNKLMREFDDYSILASSTPQTQLIQIIPDLQRILRDAEDQSVPPCLNNLKQSQLNHMRTVVQTLIAFMSATDESGVEVINAGIAQARSFHDPNPKPLKNSTKSTTKMAAEKNTTIRAANKFINNPKMFSEKQAKNNVPTKTNSILNFFQIQSKQQIVQPAQTLPIPKNDSHLNQLETILEDEPLTHKRLKKINQSKTEDDFIYPNVSYIETKGKNGQESPDFKNFGKFSNENSFMDKNSSIKYFKEELQLSKSQIELKENAKLKLITTKLAQKTQDSQTISPKRNKSINFPQTTKAAPLKRLPLTDQKPPKPPSAQEPPDEFEDKTPNWALPEFALDKNKRPPSHPEYDPTSLHIPPEAFKKLTPCMQQYWRYKSENFDKVLLFKLGKFYELFYEDASLSVKYLDLNFMGRKQHAGFPESSLDRYLGRLVDLGFKVAIVEQTETDRDMKARLKSCRASKLEKVIQRDLVAIHTKGTMPRAGDESLGDSLSCLWSVYQKEEWLSVAIASFDSGELNFIEFDTRKPGFLNEFKILLVNFSPSEILLRPQIVSDTVNNLIQTLPHKPQMTFPHFFKENISEIIWKKVKELNEPFFSDLQNQIIANCEIKSAPSIKFCLAQLFGYLDSLLSLPKMLVAAKLSHLKSAFHAQSLYLDSQALGHLEILETQAGEAKGSLYWLINKCATGFGRRILRQRMSAPLTNANEISARLFAIELLESKKSDRQNFVAVISKFKDLEKIACQLYKYSLIGEKKIISYQDLSTKRLGELHDFLDQISKGRQALNELRLALDSDFKASPKSQCRAFAELTNHLPEIQAIISDLEDHIILKDGVPIPTPGFDQDFDKCERNIKEVLEQAEAYICELRRRLKCNEVSLVQAKARFEVEVPDRVIGKNGKPSEFEFSSRRQNYDRFVTPQTEKLVDLIEFEEERRTQILVKFNAYIFKRFLSYRSTWDALIRLIGEIDVLCGISSFCFDGYQNLCKPVVHDFNPNSVFMRTENIRHPVLSSMNPEFVGNDLNFSNGERAFILTGPNMGGKSTIMRTLALNVILAQIGCYVFADNFEFSLFDKIFTRIGASDKLEESKSTFFIEMEETLQIINNGTMHSLAIVDELGRGTSTFDGYSIACACLKFFMRAIKCRLIFSTHYFFIREDLEDTRGIVFKRMAYQICQTNNIDRLRFLYKIEEGMCEKSFALNVALLAGIGQSIVERADQITTAFREHIDF